MRYQLDMLDYSQLLKFNFIFTTKTTRLILVEIVVAVFVNWLNCICLRARVVLTDGGRCSVEGRRRRCVRGRSTALWSDCTGTGRHTDTLTVYTVINIPLTVTRCILSVSGWLGKHYLAVLSKNLHQIYSTLEKLKSFKVKTYYLKPHN